MSLCRPIKSELKSRRIMLQEEKPIRWSYQKILREFSTLKEFYPDINPYVEVYRLRENIYCLFSESLDGAGDPWMFVIDGPEKAMLIDTSYGVGDLKGLVNYLTGNKPLIVCNTHFHGDHALGDPQFDEIWIHEYDAPYLDKDINQPHLWDHMYDENGKPKYAEFDPADQVKFSHFEIRTFQNGHIFDLGNNYQVEVMWLPGHTPGNCGFLDKQNHVYFTGDITIMGCCDKTMPYHEYACIETMNNELENNILPRLNEIEGVFPSHGTLDQSNNLLDYLHDATSSVMADPHNYDKMRSFTYASGTTTVYTKNIYEFSCLRYNPEEDVFFKKGNCDE